MLYNRHSNLSEVSSKHLNTALKSSIVLFSTVFVAACGLDSSTTSYYSNPIVNPTTSEGSQDTDIITDADSDTSEETTPDASEETTTPDDSEGTTPPDDSEGTTPPDDSEGTTPPDDSEGTTPPDDSEGTTPPDDSENPAIPVPTTPHAPESSKTGAQTLNVNAGPLGVFKTTTRDFDADDTSVQARSDVASNNLLPPVDITTSSASDTAVSNGFKKYDGESLISITTPIVADLPLTYSSVYKDFDSVMRIGHIDGSAALGTSALPVNGAAVIGNATLPENVPSEGIASYVGDATYRQLGVGNNIEFGQSAFTADFTAGKVEGDLKFASAGTISLSADINGNEFIGSGSGYNTEGGFYGGDAEFLGGIYEGKDAQGTYGAKR